MENLDKVKKEIQKLRDQIQKHDHLYYVLSNPEISDKEYDNLLKKLDEYDEAHGPGYVVIHAQTFIDGDGI